MIPIPELRPEDEPSSAARQAGLGFRLTRALLGAAADESSTLQHEKAVMEIALAATPSGMALVIPTSVLRELALPTVQRWTLDATSGRQIVLTPMPQYRLAELLAQCDLAAAPPADIAAWDR